MLIGPLGLPELLIIVLVVLLLFGSRKIPELMRSVGEGVREFKNASKEITGEVQTTPKVRSESDKLREAATNLGISTEGRSDEEIRRDISSRVGG